MALCQILLTNELFDNANFFLDEYHKQHDEWYFKYSRSDSFFQKFGEEVYLISKTNLPVTNWQALYKNDQASCLNISRLYNDISCRWPVVVGHRAGY